MGSPYANCVKYDYSAYYKIRIVVLTFPYVKELI